MKKIIALGLLIGLVIGVVQAQIPYLKTTSFPAPAGTTTQTCAPSSKCYCPYGTHADNCQEVSDRHFYRGWPLANVGTDGTSQSFEQPPRNTRTYANVAIWAVGTPVILVGLYYLIGRRLNLSKATKTVLIVGAIVGAALGVGQVFYKRVVLTATGSVDMRSPSSCEEKVATCGYCPAEQRHNNYCYFADYPLPLRGWPMSHDTYDTLSQYDVSPTYLLNFAILTLGTPIAAVAVYSVVKRARPVPKATTKATRAKK